MSLRDESLLRECLSAMPLGKYHTRDGHPYRLYRDGVLQFSIHTDHIYATKPGVTEGIQGCIAALVHLLNTREQTDIPR